MENVGATLVVVRRKVVGLRYWRSEKVRLSNPKGLPYEKGD